MSETNSFWDFSLDFYGRPGVAAACLGLQDEAGLDVNILLFCIWVAKEGRARLDEAMMRRCMAVTSGWQEDIVAPLRALRHRCKDATALAPAGQREAMHRELAAAELHAERVEQDLLFALSRDLGPSDDDDVIVNAGLNLEQYSALVGVPLGSREKRQLLVLLGAI